MKKIILFCLFAFVSVFVFAAFPVEAQLLIVDADPETFKLDFWGFIIGILTTPLMIFFGLPCLLLFINKKHFRKSLLFGWLAGLVLVILISVASSAESVFLY